MTVQANYSAKKAKQNQQLLEQQAKISAYSAYNKSVLHSSFTQSLKPLRLNNNPPAGPWKFKKLMTACDKIV
jgi:hypothetical protein